jgi:short-subunit dehydrogenase
MSAGMNDTLRCHILITGATGGIGGALARLLARPDTRLSFVARDAARLQRLVDALAGFAYSATAISADLGDPDSAALIAAEARRRHGPIDILVNNAAVNGFGHLEDLAPREIQRVFATNLMAPVLLTRAVVPEMIARKRGQIVNIGSIFGSIGFAGFSAYSSGKFALRGFSEALRRELDGSGVAVTYVAPRYTKTALNSPAVNDMALATRMAMDEPADVARQIVAAIESRRAELVIGRAERVFVRLNALWPKLVDRGLVRTTRRIREIVKPAA